MVYYFFDNILALANLALDLIEGNYHHSIRQMLHNAIYHCIRLNI